MRENFGRYLLCCLLMAVGLGAFAIKSWIDVEYWVSQAVTPAGKWQFGGAAFVFCLASLAFTCAIASRLREKITAWNVFGTVLATGVLMYVTAYGMASIVGFGARERTQPYHQTVAENEAKQQAYSDAKARQIKLQDEQIAFLRAQAAKSKKKENKQAAYDALGQATFGTTAVIAAPTVAASADPQAEALHRLFPEYSIEEIQNLWVGAFGVGLLLVELFGMGFGVGMWPKYQAKAESLPAAKETAPATEIPPEPVPVASNIIHPPQFAAKAPVAEIAPEPDDASPELELEVAEHMTEVEQVNEFWDTQTRPAEAARIGVTTMYDTYRAWATKRNLRPASQKKFGTVATARGILRDKRDASAWAYLGRGLVHDGQEAGLLMVA